ncbi:MAG: ABC transporter ATP-binding protein [Planctomycetaceae bacterium]|nr:ABC transporter ATP-binding protein [Planctomycetaceae bacterium]
MIEFDQVRKIYHTSQREVAAIAELTLRVDPGEFIAVRGPSGSGKSTLLSLAGGLNLPTSGRVLVDGQPLSEMTAARRAHFRGERIGFVFQMFHLLPYLTVVENVVVAATEGPTEAIRQRAEQLLEDFGLTERMTHRPGELSAGERQRVALARALLNRPQILLADEPTGNLDPDNAQAVLELLARFHERGGTILLVTHHDRAAAYADRSLVLERGELVKSQVAENSA